MLSFSELQTVMLEAAQLVNQRPIGKKPNDPNEGGYLCPNDLLLGRATPAVPQGPFKERVDLKHRLDFIEKLVQHFWKKWYHDVFPNLVIRQKWHVAQRNIMVEDVVLIHDSSHFRGEWRLGIVRSVTVDCDGKAR